MVVAEWRVAEAALVVAGEDTAAEALAAVAVYIQQEVAQE